MNRSRVFKDSQLNRGEKNGNWNGGKTVTNRGYSKTLIHGHPRCDRDGYVLTHILVAEKKIGRFLKKGEVCHHINKNKLDNNPENIQVFKNHAEHIRHEHLNLELHKKRKRGDKK